MKDNGISSKLNYYSIFHIFVASLQKSFLDSGNIIAKVLEVSPFRPRAEFHIETSHLFCSAKKMTGFYMKCNTGLNCNDTGKLHWVFDWA